MVLYSFFSQLKGGKKTVIFVSGMVIIVKLLRDSLYVYSIIR